MEKHELREIVMHRKEKILEPYGHIVTMGPMDGFDAVYTFCQQFGGTNKYIPTLETIFRECIQDGMRKEYNGFNYAEMKRKYGYCDTQTRKILRGG